MEEQEWGFSKPIPDDAQYRLRVEEGEILTARAEVREIPYISEDERWLCIPMAVSEPPNQGAKDTVRVPMDWDNPKMKWAPERLADYLKALGLEEGKDFTGIRPGEQFQIASWEILLGRECLTLWKYDTYSNRPRIKQLLPLADKPEDLPF